MPRIPAMKIRTNTVALLSLVLCAGLPGVAFGQIEEQDSQQPLFENAEASRASITFTTEDYAIGSCLQTERPEFDFEFTNSGGSVLEIAKVTPSCGCTTSDLVKRKYAPGESGKIHVKYDPTNKFGPQNKHITVSSNDPKRPEITLRFSANVEPAVIVEPRVVNFGSVNKDEERKVRLEITGRTEDFDATFATVQRTELIEVKKLDEKPVEVLVEGKKMRRVAYELVLKPGAGVGRLVDLLSIRTTDTREPVINCQIAGTIMPDIRPEPMVIAFGAVQAGKEFSGEARLTHRLGKDFKVERVEVIPAPGAVQASVQVNYEPAGVGSYLLKCTGTAPDSRVAQPLTGKLIVHTDSPGEPSVEISYALQLRIRPVKPANAK